MTRSQLARYLAKQAPTLVAMEACGGAHHWGRTAQRCGHEVMLIPAKRVKPFRHGQKTDANDAVAIGVTARQPDIHRVALKDEAMSALQAAKRWQEHCSDQATATSNLIRGVVAEFGLTVRKGNAWLRRELACWVEEADNGMPSEMRHTLTFMQTTWLQQLEDLHQAKTAVQSFAKSLEPCQRLSALEGIGPMNAVGLYLRLGNGSTYEDGRQAAACIGVTPGQYSSGGKVVTLGISKRCGDKRLRSSLITGFWAVVQALHRRPPKTPTERWLVALIERQGPNRAAVGLANRQVRRAWAMLANNTAYDPNYTVAA